eukprot:TRINITY_DN107516_c0_g1_i1.p1 TRINITY_DN107516_c0_g1~~TRINITY_DN107516_c0_g1_i1.p1  ORF type:complete len:215 (+),score=38.44 TRINITY_DN107516_c0_g1_i1:31-675(+)
MACCHLIAALALLVPALEQALAAPSSDPLSEATRAAEKAVEAATHDPAIARAVAGADAAKVPDIAKKLIEVASKDLAASDAKMVEVASKSIVVTKAPAGVNKTLEQGCVGACAKTGNTTDGKAGAGAILIPSLRAAQYSHVWLLLIFAGIVVMAVVRHQHKTARQIKLASDDPSTEVIGGNYMGSDEFYSAAFEREAPSYQSMDIDAQVRSMVG